MRQPLATATTALLLALAPLLGAAPAAAQSRHACVPASGHSHPAHACAKHQSHKRSHARHAAKTHAGHRGKQGKPTSSGSRTGGATSVPATCEDGSAPTAAAGGGFSCPDGSEPACTDGTEPVAAAAKLVCAQAPSSASGGSFECDAEGNGCPGATITVAPACADASDATWSSQGYYTCADGSRPSCESGWNPALTAGGEIVYCEPAEEE